MSRTYKDTERNIRIRAIRKDSPDLRRLARALIALAEAQAETEAQRAYERANQHSAKPERVDRLTPVNDSEATARHERAGDAA